MLDQIERFEEKYMPEPNSGCWLWIASCNSKGYGRFFFNGKVCVASRAAWMIFRGEIPDGMLVLHQCDTPQCVNPGHLFLGTNQDNMDDKVAKGRVSRPTWNKGENSPVAKLTDRAVLQIRADERPYSRIAEDHSVSKSTVYQIKKGNIWRHLL